MNIFDNYNSAVKSSHGTAELDDFLGGAGNFLGGAGKGALGGIPFGPLGMAAGGVLGAIGSGLNAISKNKQSKRDEAFKNKQLAEQKRQFNIGQQNAERTMGMNAINYMKDDFRNALRRRLTGGL